MDKNYGGVIWTNHVLERLKERSISQGDAWATWNKPDNSRFSKSKGGWVYERRFGNKRIELVAKKNDQNKWILLSVWSKPAKLSKGDVANRGNNILISIKNFILKSINK